jgi:phytol kinase
MAKMPVTPLEIRRQLFHIFLGLLLVSLLSQGILDSWALFWILVAGIFVSWVSVHYRIPLVGWFLDTFERKQVRPGKGAITYFIGVILALQLFPPEVAYAAILILAVGDGVSSLIGPFGKLKTRLSDKKLFEGTIAGSAFGGAAAMAFVSPFEAFLAAFIAMLFEAVEIRFNQKLLNDNVTVPLVAGTVIVLLRSWWLV